MDKGSIKFHDKIYIRKLHPQELGYRSGKPGGGGRYFYVSKSCTSFFPPLSETIKNDHILLDIIPAQNDEVVLTKYVYHNDRLISQEGTRNEYRLYLNSKNDPQGDYFKPEDIVLIVKLYEGENLLYKLLRMKPTYKDYAKINSILSSVGSRYKSHAIVPLSKLTFVDLLRKITVGSKVIPEEIIQEAFKEPIRAPISEEDKEETTRLIRNRSFRDLVLYFYNYRCAVTGKDLLINYKNFNNLEAAHLIARSAGGGSNPSNGIALERNLHWAFDKGFFTVTFKDPDYYIEVHPDALKVSYLAKINGAKLIIPEDSRSRPNLESLKWHKKNVFGLFLRVEI